MRMNVVYLHRVWYVLDQLRAQIPESFVGRYLVPGPKQPPWIKEDTVPSLAPFDVLRKLQAYRPAGYDNRILESVS